VKISRITPTRFQKTNRITPYKVGDLVRVRAGTHDSKLPVHRTGLIVRVDHNPLNRSGGLPPNINRYSYYVKFGNAVLYFHHMWLDAVS
jgi:hypothetical protein